MRRAIVVLLLLIANALFGSNKVKTAPERAAGRDGGGASFQSRGRWFRASRKRAARL